MRHIFLIFTFVFLAAVSTAHAAEPATAYDPSKFTISYWCGPPAEELTLERFREIKEANFTLALPPCAGMTVEQNRRMLDLCREVGLQAIISDGRMVRSIAGEGEKAKLEAIVRDYSGHPALLGYHLADEPAASAFDSLAQVVSHLREKDPRHPAYVNLFPTYARDFDALGTASYEEYVRTYAEKVRPFVISYDHYALTVSSDRADFFENLATVRKVSLEKDIPFWNIVLATQHFGYRNLTEAELRFQAMQTLAFGARGLLWFTYWMPRGVPEPESWKHSLILADGTRDPHYKMVKSINADVKAIGDELGTARSTAVFQVGEGATIPPDASPIAANGGKLTIGVFEQADKTLAVVANRDYKNATETQVSVTPKHVDVEVFDPATKTWSTPTVAVDWTVLLDLAAGGGVLVRW